MRRVRYSVASSLDGYIADREGGYGWIPEEPGIDFRAFFATVDTALMGRKSWEPMADPDAAGRFGAMDVYVFSSTLDPEAHPDVTVVRKEDAVPTVEALKAEEGKDIWLFGGGLLFRSLLEAGLVDTVEVGLVPVLLGDGIPLLPETPEAVELELEDTERFPSGIVFLRYRVSGRA